MAVKFSEKLANIYRYFLEQEKQDVIILREELTFCENYLELFQSRFENGLEFKINIDKEYQKKVIVSTTLQQVLENVVKHNEISAESPVTIKMYVLDDYLIVENNKKPKLSEVKSNLNGIKNIELRYRYFSDKKLFIEQTKDFYKIKIPLLTV